MEFDGLFKPFAAICRNDAPVIAVVLLSPLKVHLFHHQLQKADRVLLYPLYSKLFCLTVNPVKIEIVFSDDAEIFLIEHAVGIIVGSHQEVIARSGSGDIDTGEIFNGKAYQLQGHKIGESHQKDAESFFCKIPSL